MSMSNEERKEEKISKKIFTEASLLGLDQYENPGSKGFISNEFGLCNDCKHLQLVRSEFKVLYAKCFELDIILNAHNPVIECTEYCQRNSMTLSQMQDIAYLIESEHRQIGFEVEEVEKEKS